MAATMDPSLIDQYDVQALLDIADGDSLPDSVIDVDSLEPLVPVTPLDAQSEIELLEFSATTISAGTGLRAVGKEAGNSRGGRGLLRGVVLTQTTPTL